MTDVYWPARMQRLKTGALAAAAPEAELWLDGGHNPAAGETLAETLRSLPDRPTHLICGMLNTKDIAGYLRPLATITDTLTGVSIPDATATLSAAETVDAARSVGMTATEAESVEEALQAIATREPGARILICGSLYLAGHVLRENA